MKSTVEHLSPTRVRINVEVPFAELQPDIDKVYKQLAKQVRIPGFRPGKAPAKLLEARIGRGAVLEQVVNDSLESRYSEAVSSVDVRPVGKPEIEVTKIEDGEELVFTAEVDIRPPIPVPDLSALKVTVDPIKVTDEEVDAELQSLRARFGTVTGVERPAQQGDLVSIDLSATVDGEDVSDASTQGLSYEAGSGKLIADLDEVILGMSAGDSQVFTTTLSRGNYAGQEAEVTVTVHAVKERELPEPDDEFAQLASEFDTVDELRAGLLDQAQRLKRVQQAEQIRDVALTELLGQVDIPLPDAIVQAAFDHILHDEIERHGHDEARFAEALAERGSSREEFDANARENAEKGVKTQLVVDAVADELKVQVGQDDLTERLVLQSRQYGVEPQQLLKYMQENNQLPVMFADVRRGKALAAVVRAATVTDTDGNPIDTDEFFGLEEEESAADETPTATGEDDEIDEIDDFYEIDEDDEDDAGQVVGFEGVDEGDKEVIASAAQDETEDKPAADESK